MSLDSEGKHTYYNTSDGSRKEDDYDEIAEVDMDPDYENPISGSGPTDFPAAGSVRRMKALLDMIQSGGTTRSVNTYGEDPTFRSLREVYAMRPKQADNVRGNQNVRAERRHGLEPSYNSIDL